jgi:hypothetical protein
VSLTRGVEYYSQQSVLSDPVKKVHRRWAVMMHEVEEFVVVGDCIDDMSGLSVEQHKQD